MHWAISRPNHVFKMPVLPVPNRGVGFLADSHSVLNLDDSVAVAQEFIGLY